MYPHGLAPQADGTGFRPEGLQQILSARYSQPGVIAGLELTASATLMQISVGAGAAAVSLASGLLVEVPVAPINLTLAAAPATGSRVDIIAIAGATGELSVVSAVPAGSQEIGRVTVPAGATKGTGCPISSDRIWALLQGASQGVVATWTETTAANTQIPTSKQTLATLRLSPQPSPRLIECLLQSCLAHATVTGSTMYEILLDGVVNAVFEMSHTNYREAKHIHHKLTLAAGVAHTIAVTRAPWIGSRPYVFGGVQDGKTYPRTMLQITDLTVSRA